MPEKRKKTLKIVVIAVLAGVLTLAVALAYRHWGAAYQTVPDNAAEWKVPENEEVRAKVEEIADRILGGGRYGFDDLLYVLDHDSETGQKVLAHLTEQGMNLSSLPETK